MSKCKKTSEGVVIFNCPACGHDHGVDTVTPNRSTGALWQFNENYDKPTITPSIHVLPYERNGKLLVQRCHSFVTDGMIRYLGDCTHELAGQQIELPEFE